MRSSSITNSDSYIVLFSLVAMSSNLIQTEEKIQANDSTATFSAIQSTDSRQDGHFIDDETLLEWSEESGEEQDDEEIEEEYDDNRVEDEDWEVAEGGMSIIKQSLQTGMNVRQILQSSIIV